MVSGAETAGIIAVVCLYSIAVVLAYKRWPRERLKKKRIVQRAERAAKKLAKEQGTTYVKGAATQTLNQEHRAPTQSFQPLQPSPTAQQPSQPSPTAQQPSQQQSSFGSQSALMNGQQYGSGSGGYAPPPPQQPAQAEYTLQRPRTIDELLWQIRQRTARPSYTSVEEERRDLSGLVDRIGFRLGRPNRAGEGPEQELEDLKKLTFFWLSMTVKLNQSTNSAQTWEDLYEGAMAENVSVDNWAQYVAANISRPRTVPRDVYFPKPKLSHLQLQKQIDLFRKLAFRWMVLGLRVNRSNQDLDSQRVDWEQLFEEAMAQRLAVNQWPIYIEDKLNTA